MSDIPARRRDLIVRELDGEVVVYDFSTERAHCVNELARAVWLECDGRRPVAAIALEAGRRLGQPGALDEALVWMAVWRLSEAGLLEGRARVPEVDFGRRRFARQVTLTTGLALALPAVWSILAPTPAYAATTCVQAFVCTPGSHACCGSPGAQAMCCNGMGGCNSNCANCMGRICSN